MNNLRIHVKPMYQLYSVLKEQDAPPMSTEIEVASGKRQLEGKVAHEFMQKINRSSENIRKTFQKQQAQAIVSNNYLLFISIDT